MKDLVSKLLSNKVVEARSLLDVKIKGLIDEKINQIKMRLAVEMFEDTDVEMYFEELDESTVQRTNVQKMGRTKIIKFRVRKGKIQRRKKFSSVKGYIAALEVTADKKTAWQAANQLLEWLGKSNNERMARDVGKWFNKVFKPAKGRKLKDQQIMELPIGEVANMLESNIEHWEADILEEGLQRGLQRGREEGLRAAVRLALGFKFGDLGERFWLEHLEPQERDDWEAVFQAINSAPHLDALYPLHKT